MPEPTGAGAGRRFSVTKTNWLDRIITAYAPGWAEKRQAARIIMAVRAQFAPLRQDRGTKVIGSNQGNLDERLPWWDRLKMIAMFDTLVHENPLLSGMVDQYICNVVPATGVRPIPRTGNEVFDRECQARFEEWAEDCEVRGMSFWQYQKPFLKSVIGQGDAGTVRIARGGRLEIQGISANRIATPVSHAIYENAQVHQGVYTGAGARPQGYYVVRRNKYGVEMPGQDRFVPADHMLFSYAPEKFDMDNYRGVSNFLTCFPQIQRAESLLQYKTMQEKMAAVFGIAIKKSRDKTTSPLAAIGSTRETQSATQTATTRPDIELFHGMGITLNEDEDIDTIEHKSAGTPFKEFIGTICQILGVGAGLPLEFVLLDWSRANYYGNKMVTTMAKRKFANSYMIVQDLVRFVYRWRIQQFIEAGILKVPSQIERDPLTMTCTLPPPLELDENKAFELHAKKVENNVATWEDYAMSQGQVLDHIIEAKRKELDKLKKARLPVPATTTPGVKLLSEIEKDQSE